MKLFPTHAGMLIAIQEARAAAYQEARDAVGERGVYQSRGAWALTCDQGGRVGPLIEAVPNKDWSTQKAFNKLIAEIEVKHPEVTQIFVEGGFDYAESPRAMQDGEYDPWVSDWSVKVWDRSCPN